MRVRDLREDLDNHSHTHNQPEVTAHSPLLHRKNRVLNPAQIHFYFFVPLYSRYRNEDYSTDTLDLRTPRYEIHTGHSLAHAHSLNRV